jgi:hypothetical protein
MSELRAEVLHSSLQIRSSNSRFAKRVYLIAGIWGVIIIGLNFFNERWIAINDPPPLTHPEYFYGFNAVGMAWQVLFLLLSRDPVRFRPLMPAAMLEKFGYVIAVAILFAIGRVSRFTFWFSFTDLVLGILFVVAYFNTQNSVAPAE